MDRDARRPASRTSPARACADTRRPTASRGTGSRPCSWTARGAVWAGTMGSGVNRLENGALDELPASADGLGADAIFSLFEDRAGAISDRHVRRRRDAAGRTGASGRSRRRTACRTTSSCRPTRTPRAPTGSRRGAASARYRDGRFTTYRQNEGVFHDAAQRVLEDGRGNLWLTSNRGISRVSLAELAAAAARPRSASPTAITFTTATVDDPRRVQQRAARRLQGAATAASGSRPSRGS